MGVTTVKRWLRQSVKLGGRGIVISDIVWRRKRRVEACRCGEDGAGRG